MKTLRLGSVLAALALLASVAVANAQQQVIKVGYPPFAAPLTGLLNATTTNYRTLDPKGAMAQGTMIDVMNAVAKDSGIEVQYLASAVGDAVGDLNGHAFDVWTMGNVGAASAINALLDVGTPIFKNGDCLVVLRSDTTPYKTWDDLKGDVVAVLKNTAEDGPAQSSGLFKEVKPYGDADAFYHAISSGEVQVGLGSSAISSTYALNPETATSAFAGLGLQVVASYQARFPVMTGFAAAKGNTALLAKLNASVVKLKADGTIKAIFTKYGLANAVMN